jgi:hypothetical protein
MEVIWALQLREVFGTKKRNIWKKKLVNLKQKKTLRDRYRNELWMAQRLKTDYTKDAGK